MASTGLDQAFSRLSLGLLLTCMKAGNLSIVRFSPSVASQKLYTHIVCMYNYLISPSPHLHIPKSTFLVSCLNISIFRNMISLLRRLLGLCGQCLLLSLGHELIGDVLWVLPGEGDEFCVAAPGKDLVALVLEGDAGVGEGFADCTIYLISLRFFLSPPTFSSFSGETPTLVTSNLCLNRIPDLPPTG